MSTVDLINKYKKYQGKLAEAQVGGNKEKVDLYNKKMKMYKSLIQTGKGVNDQVTQAQDAATVELDKLGAYNVQDLGNKLTKMNTNFTAVANAYKTTKTDYDDTSANAVRFANKAKEDAEKVTGQQATDLTTLNKFSNDYGNDVDAIINGIIGQTV
jgi:hypothetical protein